MTNIVLAVILLGLLLVLVKTNKKTKDTKGISKLVKGWGVFSNIASAVLIVLFVSNVITNILMNNQNSR